MSNHDYADRFCSGCGGCDECEDPRTRGRVKSDVYPDVFPAPTDHTYPYTFREHPNTYPRVRRPDLDSCYVCRTLHGDDDALSLAWYPTEDGDRPFCRSHLYGSDPKALVTTNAFTSEWGNVYPAWTEEDTAEWRRCGGDATNAHEAEVIVHWQTMDDETWNADETPEEDETPETPPILCAYCSLPVLNGIHTDDNTPECEAGYRTGWDETPTTPPERLTVEEIVTTTAREVAEHTREEDLSRMLDVFTPDVPVAFTGHHAMVLRKAMRSVLDMGYEDSLRFLSLVMVDETTDEWTLRPWTETSPHAQVSAPCAVLVRTWEYGGDGTYVPRIRVIFRQYLKWEDMGGCVRVDLPDDWYEWE